VETSLKGGSTRNFRISRLREVFGLTVQPSFLQGITENDEKLLGHTKNMCYHSGYESVALIPLQFRNMTLGLIQMNDSREYMFTSEAMERYERLADYLGEVVCNTLEIQEKMPDISDLMKKFKDA
jgi:transcriptional regulator with GAF, ATPase, and Fis domain